VTAGGALRALRRRWYVVLAGLLVTLLVCASETRAHGVFWTQVDVVFLIPPSTHAPNTLEASSSSLISTAGIVAIRVNQGKRATPLSSANVSLVGEGIFDGRSVQLPNTGGQWADNFSRPVLDVQVTGATYAAVKAELAATLADIQSELDRLQIAAGADQFNRITTQSAPTTPEILVIPPQRRRAVAATLAVGTLLTLVGAVTVDGVLRRRSAARRQPVAPHVLEQA
jgi:hypothetical protein